VRYAPVRSRSEKRRILDKVVVVAQMHRKTAIRLPRRAPRPAGGAPRRAAGGPGTMAPRSRPPPPSCGRPRAATAATSSAITAASVNPTPGEGQEQRNLWGRLEHRLDPVLVLVHLAVQPLDLLEELLGGVRRVRRKEGEALPQEGAAPRTEEIAHLVTVERVLGQGRVNPILDLRALPDKHHPGARGVPLVV
jgi:hypothetical protein